MRYDRDTGSPCNVHHDCVNAAFMKPFETPQPGDELRLLRAIQKQERALGRLSPSGRPISICGELSDLTPPLANIVRHLYDHTEAKVDIHSAQVLHMSSVSGLRLAIEKLMNHGLVNTDLSCHNEEVFFLTKRGEQLVEFDDEE